MSGMGEQARFFGKLAALLDAGIPLLKSFEVGAEQVADPGLSECLSRILDRAYGGSSLKEAFDAEEEWFSAEVRCLIGYGEESGDLEKKAASIADGLARGVFGIGGVVQAPATTGPEDVDRLVAEACAEGVSEIHLEPEADGYRVRHRVSAGLTSAGILSPGAGESLIAAVKDRTRMGPDDTTGEFLAFDHCITVGCCAYETGEGIVLAITDLMQVPSSLQAAGLSEEDAVEVRSWISGERGGLVGISGHRASGRLATAASALREIGPDEKKILAVDAPPALRVPGVVRVRRAMPAAIGGVIGQHPDAVLHFGLPEGEDLEVLLELASRGSLVLTVFSASGTSEALSMMLDCAGGRPSVPVAGVTWQKIPAGEDVPIIEVLSAS